MATTVTSNALLKEWVEETIYETINYEAFFADFADTVPYEWEGDHIRIVVHTGQNNSFTRIAEFGATPAPGNQSYLNLLVTTSESAATMSVSTRAVAASSDAPSKGALAKILDREKTGLTKDVVLGLDLDRIFGFRVKGLLNEQKANAASGGGATVAVPAAGITAWQYSGDFRPFLNCVQANTNTWVRVRMFQQDTYAEVPFTGAGAATSALFVSAIDQTLQSVTLSVVSSGGASGITTVGVAAGFAVALALHDVQFLDSLGAAFGIQVPFALEPRGVFSNLCDPIHFTADRTTATGTGTGLQSTLMTQATVAPQGRGTFTPARVQAVLDQILSKTGSEKDMPDVVVFNPLQRSVYTAVLVANTQYQAKGGGEKTDMGPKFEDVSFLGYKPKVSHHWPRGCVAFLKKATWMQPEFKKPGFMDMDGSWLARVPGQAGYSAVYQTFDNFVCAEPRANAVLTGITV